MTLKPFLSFVSTALGSSIDRGGKGAGACWRNCSCGVIATDAKDRRRVWSVWASQKVARFGPSADLALPRPQAGPCLLVVARAVSVEPEALERWAAVAHPAPGRKLAFPVPPPHRLPGLCRAQPDYRYSESD